ncbi:MAG: DegV family protein [Clostridia bacterium]|nr:DegV family protein [Clostridia bacterium]
MSVIICDSDSELWYERADEVGVQVIKMPYIVDGEEFLYNLGRDENSKEFFDKMRNGAKVSTAALNAENYKEIFEPLFKAGEEVLYIAFSSKMSGTFNYLEMAMNELKEIYPDAKYQRFDTLNISWGTGIQVYLAAKYFNEGHSIDETVKFLESLRDRVGLYFAVDTLEYLKRGGRISPVAAAFGNLLQLKPVLTVNDGSLGVSSKEKGKKKAISYMLNKLFEVELDPTSPVIVLNADIAEEGKYMADKIKEHYGDSVNVWEHDVGPIIGAHCGPGTVGIIFVKK